MEEEIMRRIICILSASVAGLAFAAGMARAEELTIATVNNGDMIIMQKLSPEWEKETGNKLNWVVLEENVLRQKVTTDIATKSGSCYPTPPAPLSSSPISGRTFPATSRKAASTSLSTKLPPTVSPKKTSSSAASTKTPPL